MGLDEQEGAAVERSEPEPLPEPPPVFGSWRFAYTAVLVNLAILMAAFYLFTRYFR